MLTCRFVFPLSSFQVFALMFLFASSSFLLLLPLLLIEFYKFATIYSGRAFLTASLEAPLFTSARSGAFLVVPFRF